MRKVYLSPQRPNHGNIAEPDDDEEESMPDKVNNFVHKHAGSVLPAFGGSAGVVLGIPPLWAAHNFMKGHNKRMRQHAGYRESDEPTLVGDMANGALWLGKQYVGMRVKHYKDGVNNVVGMMKKLHKKGEKINPTPTEFDRHNHPDYLAHREAGETPNSTPNTTAKTPEVAPSTSTSVNKSAESPAAKPKNKSGTYKAPMPTTATGPKDSNTGAKGGGAKHGDQPKAPAPPAPHIPSPEEQVQNRHGEFMARLSRISMAGPAGPAKPAVPGQPAAPAGGSAQKLQASESFSFLNVLREAGKLPPIEIDYPKGAKTKVSPHLSDAALRKMFKSTANPGVRKGMKDEEGTPVRYTHKSNDLKTIMHGRALAMRQKIMSEARRKKFGLRTGFPDMTHKQLGELFDEHSDHGMLEPGEKLDPSTLNYIGRRASRVTRRLKNNVKDFFSGLVTSKKPEKESEPVVDCKFVEGGADYPDQCGCRECQSLVRTMNNLREGNSETSMGAMVRDQTNDVTAPQEKALGALFTTMRRKQRRRRQ